MISILRIAVVAALTGSSILLSAVADAHHSPAMFDRTKPYTVTGTIESLHWQNPHVWLTLLVPNGQGGNDIYEYEGPGSTGIMRNGFKKDDFKPGTKMKFVIAPNRDGSKGGEFMAAWTADGRQVKF